jgi:hypothetical protein
MNDLNRKHKNMDINIFTEWLQRQGFKIYQTESSYWYNAGPRVLQAFPYHWLIDPPEEEIKKLMIGKGIIALRYSTAVNNPEGMISYHVVICNPYKLELLRSQARNGIKKGLSVFQVEQISFERLSDEGWALQQDTLDRQDRLSSMTQLQWRNLCMAACDLPGFEAWAAICQGELAAALITAKLNDTYYVPYAASHRKYLTNHVNNALFYTVSTNFLARSGINGIFYGLNSLDAPPSVDEFKFRMGLIAKPVRQRVVFHPLIKHFANKRVHELFEKIIQRYPKDARLAKVEGMLRFHLKGKETLTEQEWPEILTEDKTRYLKSIQNVQ